MAVSLLSFHEVSDLCIGKPPLRCLPATATVAEVLSALRGSGDSFLSVWICDYPHHSSAAASAAASERCRCVGQVSFIDVVCFLCREENLSQPLIALESPVSALLPKAPGLVNVKILEPHSSLREAIDCINAGAQNLIIPTRSRRNQKNKSLHHNGKEYCWIKQEDIVGFLLNSISVFAPSPSYSIDTLNLIEQDVLTIHYNDPVLPNLPAIHNALRGQMAVAVVDDEGRLVGEISTYALACCDETAAIAVAAAFATLSAGDLMAYIECGNSVDEDLVRLVKSRLEERKMDGMLELMEEDVFAPSPMARRTEAIVCHPESSMVALMIQALAHRVNYAWVVDQDYGLVGMVTFAGMLNVFRAGISHQTK